MAQRLRPRDHSDRRDRWEAAGGAGASVMLATLAGAPLGDESIGLAAAAAADRAARLVVVNVVDVSVGGRGPRIDVGDAPAVAASLDAAAIAGAIAGVPVTVLRVPTLHPVATIAALAADRRPALLVLGPDVERLSPLRHMSRRRLRRTIRALERRTSCLLWTPVADIAAAPRRARALPAVIANWPPGRPRLW